MNTNDIFKTINSTLSTRTANGTKAAVKAERRAARLVAIVAELAKGARTVNVKSRKTGEKKSVERKLNAARTVKAVLIAIANGATAGDFAGLDASPAGPINERFDWQQVGEQLLLLAKTRNADMTLVARVFGLVDATDVVVPSEPTKATKAKATTKATKAKATKAKATKAKATKAKATTKAA